ncbi:type II toxin-antitoxin system RelE/ParE family toxin [Actinomadura decatromicini]|uniref:Type II toxin-antitoxin system RelE/ParE family toxin n=2 Tax=Actinomadura decatromicini TaxID=2604572 RepID=A0A5D3FYC8_9ACTN|nr:type II toxin-antitoxin system RelE/ParE family toxin [Actinomadura decatromicini]
MRRYMHDQEGMHAIAAAVGELIDNPSPPEAFAWGKSDFRLRVGPYRVLYRVSGGIVYVAHVSRTTS